MLNIICNDLCLVMINCYWIKFVMNKAIILLCLVVLFCSSSAKTLDDTQTKLTIIGMPNPPFSYMKKDGNISGITVEKIKSILNDTNYSMNFH